MHKIIIRHSIKAIKFNAWVAGFLVLFITLVVMFPVLIKAPIEEKLSNISGLKVELSTPHFGFEKGKFSFKIQALKAFSTESTAPNPVISVDNLKWNVNLNLLLEDIRYPSKISIETLVFYPQNNGFDIKSIQQQLVWLSNSRLFDFFRLLRIDKTLIKGKQDLEIEPIVLAYHKHKAQLSLKIKGQSIAFNLSNMNVNKMDIIATLPIGKSDHGVLSLPIVISNKELLFNATIELFKEKGDDFVEFKGHIKTMKANDLSQYLPSQLLDSDLRSWIKNSFVAGTLQDLKIHIKENLTTLSATEIQLNAQLKALELLFDPDWIPLKQLNASFEFNGKKVVVMLHEAKLNKIDLKAIKVQIKNINQRDPRIEVIGKINTQSEHFIEFLKRSPLDKSVHETLNKINLSGKIGGNLALAISLDGKLPILDMDLIIKNNYLNIEGVVVENYDSKLAFHDYEITSQGTGNIRNLPFGIRINPSNYSDNKTRIFGVELISNSGLKAYIVKRPDQSWYGTIDSKSIKGNVVAIFNKKDIPSVQLLDIRITTLGAIKGDWKISPQDFPNMYLSTKGIYIDDNILPNFKVKLTSKDKLLVIDNLQFKGIEVDNKVLNFKGSWNGKKTQLYVKVKGEGVADFLQKLKVQERMTGGEFNFDINLACQCALWNMNYQDITGDFDINVKKGVFTDKNPHIGRVLSLLNIKSIVKRLQLNLSDVTDKGFAYENITAQIHLQNAIAKIEKFNLEASSSSIILTGQTNIIDKQYNLVAKVTPAINDAVPIATYLTGGGLIGLGVWLVDEALFDGKVIGTIVNGVAEFKYKITGLWDNPIIEDYD